MTAIINPTSLLSPNPKRLILSRSCFAPKFFSAESRTRVLNLAVCVSEERESSGNDLKAALSGVVNEQVEELLSREENRPLLDGLEKASRRVENARRELAEIERQELEAKQMRDYINQLENRASEIAECQKEISEAKAKIEEAEYSLSLNADTVWGANDSIQNESEEIDRDEERLESVKAALISALIGSLAGLPISLTEVSPGSQLILPVATTFVSCALFGVTFRYAIRRDLDNIQLKTGASAAFGVVKGLAILSGGPPLELSVESLVSHVLSGTLFVSENLIIFLFAAVGLDFSFKLGLLSPFPMKRSASR